MAGKQQVTFALLFAVLLICAHCPSPCQATLFIIGGACVAGIDTALLVLTRANLLTDLEAPLETIRNLCSGLLSITPEVVIFEQVEPQVEALIELLPRLPLELPRIRPLITNLAARIELLNRANG